MYRMPSSIWWLVLTLPLILENTEYNDIMQSDAIFCRKIDPNLSKELIINISQDKENTIVEVINYGEEISKENQEKIFNKFYQVDTTHSSEGNGIGLSIVKHIVDLHLGEIEVNCEKGKTTFRVILPM